MNICNALEYIVLELQQRKILDTIELAVNFWTEDNLMSSLKNNSFKQRFLVPEMIDGYDESKIAAIG